MVCTKKRIEKALEFCDKQDHDLVEQESLTQRRQRVKEQRGVLEGARECIISCGAIEEKVTRGWEKLYVDEELVLISQLQLSLAKRVFPSLPL
jgi:hypothetical protein